MARSFSVFPEGFTLRNRLFLLRHGLAESNVKGVIVSKPSVGTVCYGLVEKGKKQAKDAAQNLREFLISEEDLSERIVIVTSDFLRTKETANIVHECLQVKTALRQEPGLRERCLGDYDLKSGSNIKQIWVEDESDPTQTKHNVESVIAVARRMAQVVQTLNEEFEGRVLVLVSHQESLHILQALFTGTPLNLHRKGTSPPIGNCHIREMKNN